MTMQVAQVMKTYSPAEITDVNENCEIGETDKLVVGSLDVKALCPSLDVNFTAERVADEFYSSPVSVEAFT